MSKKLLILIVILLIFGAGVYFWQKSQVKEKEISLYYYNQIRGKGVRNLLL